MSVSAEGAAAGAEETIKLGVYAHWPYCARICPYCDFNVYKNRDVDAARWRAAFARDLAAWRERTNERVGARKLTSLYFGGGTPSLAPTRVIEGVIESAGALWGFEDGAEITIEANPADISSERLSSFAQAGVNRLSLGVQSFDDEELAFLGRDHDGKAARRAIDAALSVFPRTSFDMIYALPGQSRETWRRRLREALAIGAPHLSLYQLTVEQGTAFDSAVRRGAWTPPEDDITADLFDIAGEETARAGLPAYEVSNHAATGGESRHNLLYWTGADYVGVGPGAHGRLTSGGARLAIETPKKAEDYLARVESAGFGASVIETLGEEAVLTERLSMGLRLVGGVPLGAEILTPLGARAARLDRLEAEGLLRRADGRLAATENGRRLLNAVLASLLA